MTDSDHAVPTDAVLTLWAASTRGDRTDVPPDVSAAIDSLITRVSALGLEVELLRDQRQTARDAERRRDVLRDRITQALQVLDEHVEGSDAVLRAETILRGEG